MGGRDVARAWQRDGPQGALDARGLCRVGAAVLAAGLWRVLGRVAVPFPVERTAVTVAVAGVLMVVFPATGPLRFSPPPGTRARSRGPDDREARAGPRRDPRAHLDGRHRSGHAARMVRADLLTEPNRLEPTSFQLEYLPSGLVCKGGSRASNRSAFVRAVEPRRRASRRRRELATPGRGHVRGPPRGHRRPLALRPALLAAGCSRHPSAHRPRRAGRPRRANARAERARAGCRALGLPRVHPALVPGYLLIADRNNNRAIIVSPAKKIVWERDSLRGPDDAFFTPGYRGVITNEEFNDTLVEVSLRTKAGSGGTATTESPGSSPAT